MCSCGLALGSAQWPRTGGATLLDPGRIWIASAAVHDEVAWDSRALGLVTSVAAAVLTTAAADRLATARTARIRFDLVI